MMLVRHGHTAFNAAAAASGVDPGVSDPGLTALGRRQAAKRFWAGCGVAAPRDPC